MIYYPLAIHQQKGYEKYYAKAESLGIAEKLANEVLSLPMHTELDEIQFDYICKAVKDFFEQK